MGWLFVPLIIYHYPCDHELILSIVFTGKQSMCESNPIRTCLHIVSTEGRVPFCDRVLGKGKGSTWVSTWMMLGAEA